MTSKTNDGAAVFDAVTLERDLAKLNLERPITDIRRFFLNYTKGPYTELRAIYLDGWQLSSVLYTGDESEVISMFYRLNQYLRMIRSLTGGIS